MGLALCRVLGPKLDLALLLSVCRSDVKPIEGDGQLCPSEGTGESHKDLLSRRICHNSPRFDLSGF